MDDPVNAGFVSGMNAETLTMEGFTLHRQNGGRARLCFGVGELTSFVVLGLGVADRARQRTQVALHELREVGGVAEAEVRTNARYGSIGVRQQSVDLQCNSLVEHLLGGLARDLLARSIDCSRAVTQVVSEFSDPRSFVQALLDQAPEVDVGRGKLRSAARSFGKHRCESEEKCAQKRLRQLDAAPAAVKSDLFASELLDPTHHTGEGRVVEVP